MSSAATQPATNQLPAAASVIFMPRSRLSAPMILGKPADRPGLTDQFQRLQNERLHSDDRMSFRIGVAATSWQHSQADNLVTRQYRQVGYSDPHPAAYWKDQSIVALALRNSLSSREPLAMGTLTLRFDGPNGLLADEQYKDTLNALRARGRRVAEFGRLGIEASAHTYASFVTLLGELVQTAAQSARDELQVSDIFALCHPRHAHFYCRALGFSRCGDLSFIKHLGKPALLLHLPIERLESLSDSSKAPTHLHKLRKTIASNLHYIQTEEAANYACA